MDTHGTSQVQMSAGDGRVCRVGPCWTMLDLLAYGPQHLLRDGICQGLGLQDTNLGVFQVFQAGEKTPLVIRNKNIKNHTPSCCILLLRLVPLGFWMNCSQQMCKKQQENPLRKHI